MNKKTMKQTAVEWLYDKWSNCGEWKWEEIKQWFEQAKQMEAEQSKIPELSDDEINKASKKDDYFPVQSYAFIEGAEWYREQLKQRQ